MIRIQTDDFDPGREVEALTRGRTEVGAVVTFTGLVRDHAQGKAVSGIVLEHYPAMAMRELESIEAEARRRWALQDCLVIHRHGALAPGQRIVLVVTLSAHRGDAFAAAEFLMDYLKTRATFWKRETTAAGSDWVEAKTSDDEAADRWNR